MSWKIIYYESRRSEKLVFEFIQSFEMKTRARIIDTLALLEERGIKLGLPYSKKISGTNLWEIRIIGENNLRIFYVAIIEKSFLVLHGFKKKKQKTDKHEIKTALERLKEFDSRKT